MLDVKKILVFFIALSLPLSASASILGVQQGGTASSTLSGILFGNGISQVKTLTIGANLTLTGSTLSASGGSSSGFSTTSSDFWINQYDKGFFFSTTSATFFLSTNTLFSTTSADFWKTQRNFFATTSADYWETQQPLRGTATTSFARSGPITLINSASALTYGFSGLTTTTQPSSSNLLTSNGANGVFGTATSTGTVSSPLTGNFICVGSGCTLGIQAASASQAGSMAAGDFQRLYTATTTFSAPLVYTLGTNAVTLPASGASQNGYLASTDWQLLHTATTTFSAPLVYTLGTNAVTCPTCVTSAVTSLAASGNASVSGSTGAVTITVPWAFTDTTVFGPHAISTTTAFIDFPGLVSATSTFGTVTATSGITNLSVKNALVLNSAAGLEGAYGGASACGANNFVTTISAIGGTSCGTASVTINTSGGLSGGGTVSLGGSLNFATFSYPWAFNLLNTFATSTNSTSTSYWTQGVYFASSTAAASQFPYASSTALTAGNLFATAATITNASTTNFTASTYLEVPGSATPANVKPTQITINTTVASSSITAGGQLYFASTTVSFSYPTSTPAATTTNLFVQNANRGYKIDSIACLDRGAASSTVEVGNGVSTTTYQSGFTYPIPLTLSTPLLVDAWKTLYINIGTWGSTGISNVTCGMTKDNAY